MRGLCRVILFSWLVIQIIIFAMPNPARMSFAASLIKVSQGADLKRTNAQEKSLRLNDCTKVTHVPSQLIDLGVKQGPEIKDVFNKFMWGVPHQGLTQLILEYFGDDYAHYKELLYFQHDSYGCMVSFYPCVGLLFDEDGTNIHAQLNASRNNYNHQLVRWNLFFNSIGRHEITDYDWGAKNSTRENVEKEVSRCYMWWKAKTINAFNESGAFKSPNILRVTLQYNLLHMLKAMLS